MEDFNSVDVEEIFEVINKLDDAGKRCVLRLGKDILFIDEVRNESREKTESRRNAPVSC